MTTTARALTRAIPQTTSALAHHRTPVSRQFLQHSRRAYSSNSVPRTSRKAWGIAATAASLAFAGGYYLTSSSGSPKRIFPALPETHPKKGNSKQSPGLVTPTATDYQSVYNAIARKIWQEDDYDDGSYGPILLRLAWHASGTYDAETGTGGSNGATMRFKQEGGHGANAGLQHARDFLEPIKREFPWISYSDLWTLAGVCAVQEMQGPRIPWRPGRQDRDVSYCTPDGRLPDGSKGHGHLRAIFGRMGFDDQEIVALSGAHALGRCHTDRSGFEGPWTFSPTILTNDFFRLLLQEEWEWRDWSGPKQYQDKGSRSLMMLPSDYALVEDDKFKKWVEVYAKDADKFMGDFKDVVVKLFELGVPFEQEEHLNFRTFDEQALEA